MTRPRKKDITPAEPTVLIEGRPAATSGHSPGDDGAVISGEPTVLAAGRPAATISDQSNVTGRPTVLIKGHPAAGDG